MVTQRQTWMPVAAADEEREPRVQRDACMRSARPRVHRDALRLRSASTRAHREVEVDASPRVHREVGSMNVSPRALIYCCVVLGNRSDGAK